MTQELKHIRASRQTHRSLLRTAAAVCAAAVGLTLVSCGYGLDEFFSHGESVHSRADTLSDIAAPSISGGKTAYRVIVFSDVHFGGTQDHDSVDTKFFNWIQGLKDANDGNFPEFCICLGDIVDHGNASEYSKYTAFTARLESTFGLRTYTVLGNHDLFNSGWDIWKKTVFPYVSFYRFKTSSFSWYFLDTGSGSLGTGQMDALTRAMESDPNPKLVFSHYPVYANGEFYFVMQNTYERTALLTLYANNNVKHVMDGHSHIANYYDFGSFAERTPGCYLSDRTWALLYVDEANKTVRSESAP